MLYVLTLYGIFLSRNFFEINGFEIFYTSAVFLFWKVLYFFMGTYRPCSLLGPVFLR